VTTTIDLSEPQRRDRVRAASSDVSAGASASASFSLAKTMSARGSNRRMASRCLLTTEMLERFTTTHWPGHTPARHVRVSSNQSSGRREWYLALVFASLSQRQEVVRRKGLECAFQIDVRRASNDLRTHFVSPQTKGGRPTRFVKHLLRVFSQRGQVERLGGASGE
jgi:hypothetical protein